MNLNEFKAWFDGFTESLDGAPTEKQWARVKERVAEIVPQATPYPVFVDRYAPGYPYWQWHYYGPYYGTTCGSAVSNSVGSQTTAVSFSSNFSDTLMALFADLGRADFASVERADCPESL
jgi:hypothetical protein